MAELVGEESRDARFERRGSRDGGRRRGGTGRHARALGDRNESRRRPLRSRHTTSYGCPDESPGRTPAGRVAVDLECRAPVAAAWPPRSVQVVPPSCVRYELPKFATYTVCESHGSI